MSYRLDANDPRTTYPYDDINKTFPGRLTWCTVLAYFNIANKLFTY